MGSIAEILAPSQYSMETMVPLPHHETPRGPYPEGIPTDVCDLFDRLTRDLLNRGLKHYSADAILHRIRWYHHVEQNNSAFKCNNNWTATLARWFMETHPTHAGFFSLRTSRSDKE